MKVEFEPLSDAIGVRLEGVDLHVEQLNPGEIRLKEVTELCRELGFTSLLREFLEQAPAAPAVSAGIESEELRTPEAKPEK